MLRWLGWTARVGGARFSACRTCLVLAALGVLPTVQVAADALPKRPIVTVKSRSLPVRARSLESAPQLALLHSDRREWDTSTYPRAAPASYQEAAALTVPDIQAYELDFGGREGQWFRGPDGGAVYRWAEGRWQWERRDGIKVLRWDDGGWTLEQRGFRVNRIGSTGGWAAGRIVWTFPDGSELARYERLGVLEFSYLLRAPERLVTFEIYEPGRYAPKQMNSGPFRIHYAEPWQEYVRAFESWQGRNTFFQMMRRDFGFENRGPIPLIMHYDRRTWDRFYENGNRAAGVAGWQGMGMCCGSDYKLPAVDDAAVLSAWHKSQDFYVLLHETTHNLQQHRCHYVRGNRSLPEPPYPGAWYVEGVADLAAMLAHGRVRTNMIRDFYDRMDKGALPADVRRTAYNTAHDPYVSGRSLLYYIYRQRGPKAVRDFYDTTCLGTDPEASMQRATGETILDNWRAALAWFRRERANFQRELLRWQTDGLQLVTARPGDGSRLPVDFALPRNLFELTDVPHFLHAYRMDLSAYAGKMTGEFRGPRGERVRLFEIKNANYNVQVPDGPEGMLVTYWHVNGSQLESVVVEWRGHRIINWANGGRQWRFPDGRHLHRWPDGNKGFFDGQGKPLSR